VVGIGGEELKVRKSMSAGEAAESLGVEPQTIWKKVRLGEIPYRRLGRRILIDRDDFDRWYLNLPGKTADQVIQAGRCRP
jgi:excisionase family DNA binding protein